MKRMICLLLSACMLLCLAACGENTGQPPGTESMDTTENQDGDHSHEIRLLTPEKTLHTYYEWEDDYDRALVRSEHSCVTLGQADADAYPEMAQVLDQIAAMQENAMLDEFDNLVSIAREELSANRDGFETNVSTLDVLVRRADNHVISLLSDSYSHYGQIENYRVFHGSNYDTQSGRELLLNDVVTVNADLLTDSEESALLSKLANISSNQQMDIVIVTVNDLDGETPRDYADDFYDFNCYAEDGVLLLISMENSDWYISTSGYGITAVTDAGREHMAEQFVDDLGDGDYYDAFVTYTDLCDEFINMARSGDPFDVDDLPKEDFNYIRSLLVSIGIGLVVALIIRAFAKFVVKSVPAQQKFTAFFVDTRGACCRCTELPRSGQNTGASYFGLKPITCHNIVLTVRFRNSHTRTCLSVLVDCNRKAGAFCIADLRWKF